MAYEGEEYGAWAVYDGFDEFVDKASYELPNEAQRLMDSFGTETIRQSTYHPNGFMVYKDRADAASQLRLHIWPTTASYNILPHTHPWHLASMVMAGTYVEFLPVVELEPDSNYELMVPDYSEAGQQLRIKSTGRSVSFLAGRPRTYDAGECHFLPAGAFHSTLMPDREPIITVMLTSPQFYTNPSFVKDKRQANVTNSLASDRRTPTAEEAEAIWESLRPIL